MQITCLTSATGKTKGAVMTKAPLLLALAAAALAGCDKSDHNITATGPYDPQANAAANVAKPAELPVIVASATYRCKDNSLVSIDWLSAGTKNSANVTPKGGSLTIYSQAEKDGPYATADGKSLTGSPQAPSITYGGQSCKK